MASGADNVARGDGEEAGAATEVDDGHPRTHPGVPQRRTGRERLGALLRKEALRVVRTEAVRPVATRPAMVAMAVAVVRVAVVPVAVAVRAVASLVTVGLHGSSPLGPPAGGGTA
jgi:hypothetical protein